MSVTALPKRDLTSIDRFCYMLVFAMAFHAAVIFGVGFTMEAPPKKQELPPTLEITLVQSQQTEAPDQAEHLAQANQDGSGNTQEQTRPTSPPPAPLAQTEWGTSMQSSPAKSTLEAHHLKNRQVMTQLEAEEKLQMQEEAQSRRALSTQSAELTLRNMQLADLQAAIDETVKTFSERPKHRYITTRAREYRDAAYLAAWRHTIEHVGNINYPTEARSKGMSGSLLLDVAINSDGVVVSVDVRRSSGYKLLDDAAIRIVRLASPFAPFTEEMKKDTDILHITRTWEFLDEQGFSTR